MTVGLEIPDETRRAPLRDAQNVVEYENLAVDMRPGPDADDWHSETLGDRTPDFIRNAFEQHDIGTCIL